MSTHFFFPYEYSPEKERAFKIFSYCFLKPLEPKLLAIFNNFIIITYFLVGLKDVSKCTILVDTTLSKHNGQKLEKKVTESMYKNRVKNTHAIFFVDFDFCKM